MAEIICPMCSKSNPAEAETCRYCGARLKPLIQSPVPPQGGEEKEADWLRGLRDEGILSDAQLPSEPAQPAAPETSAEQEGEMPDWLAKIRQKTQDEGSVSPIGPAPVIGEQPGGAEEELPDWLRDLTLTGSGASSMPGWMQPAEPAVEEETPPATQQPAVVPPEDMPANLDNDAWLRSLGDWANQGTGQAQPAEPVQPPAESEPPSFAAQTPEPEAISTEVEPQAAEQQPEAAAQESEPEHKSFGITGWLRALDEQGKQGGASTPAEETPQSAADSDWLSNFGASAAQPTEPAFEAEQAQPSAQTPDWLNDLGAQTGAPEVVQPTQAQESPDWLSTFEQESAVADVPPVGEQDESTAALPADNLPGWLQAIETQQPAAGTPAFAGLDSADLVGPFTGQEESTWVSSSEMMPDAQEQFELPAFTVETGETQAVVESPEMAEWATGQAPEEEPKPESEGIELAQLPTWLQAMRPLDSSVQQAAAKQEREIVEKSGPLAGISGVLPGEEVVTQYRKPQVYSARLKVSDKQQVLASLLETVVAEESLAQPLKGEPTQAHHVVVRLVVALMLIAVIILGLMVRPLVGISAGLIAPGSSVSQVSGSVNALPEASPVLVVIDYEAGLSGELEAAAAPVIQHLMNRKARMVLISTQPVGTVLGEELLKAAADPQRGGVKGYSISQSTANLGYLVGGAIALRELAAPMGADAPRPLQQILPAPFRAEGGWNGLVLKSLSQVTDFKRVILLTDSVENGRAWIEQVQPALQGKTPLLVISSAQAAPLLLPYQSSGQVNGLISGLVGGRAYEELQRRPAVAGAYWNAYLLGLGLVILLVLFGGLVMAFSAVIRRGRKHNQAVG